MRTGRPRRMGRQYGSGGVRGANDGDRNREAVGEHPSGRGAALPMPSRRPSMRPLRPVVLLALLLVLPLTDRARAIAATVPTGFTDQAAVTVGSGAALDRPASMAFLPDGRLLVVEQTSAKLRLFVDGALAATDPVVTLPAVRDRGRRAGAARPRRGPGLAGAALPLCPLRRRLGALDPHLALHRRGRPGVHGATARSPWIPPRATTC